MENVLTDLEIKPEPAKPTQIVTESPRDYWRKLDLVSEYDIGSTIAGMSSHEGSFKDFLTKFVNLLLSLSKNNAKPSIQTSKTLAIMKSVVDLYCDSIDTAHMKPKDNASIMASIQGLVDQFVKYSDYKDRI